MVLGCGQRWAVVSRWAAEGGGTSVEGTALFMMSKSLYLTATTAVGE
jgi:hypothetical protein